MRPMAIIAPDVPSKSAGYPVYVYTGWFSAFNLKRAAYFLLVPFSALAIAIHQRQAVYGLMTFVLTSWPLRPRCRVEPWGLRIVWLILQDRVRWADIVAVDVAEDARRFVIGKRAPVLTIERRGGPRIILRGRSDIIARLATELAERP